MTPTALILDFGGVLTTDLWASVAACSRSHGLPDDAIFDVLHHDPHVTPLFASLERGDVDQSEVEPALAQALGVPPAGLLAAMCAELRPETSMLAAAAELRAGGVRIGILSNSWGAGYFSPYEGYNLDDRADAVVISHLARLRKPEPEIFTLAASQLDIPADECVYVDDTARYLDPAQRLGMAGLHHVTASKTIAQVSHLFGIDLL